MNTLKWKLLEEPLAKVLCVSIAYLCVGDWTELWTLNSVFIISFDPTCIILLIMWLSGYYCSYIACIHHFLPESNEVATLCIAVYLLFLNNILHLRSSTCMYITVTLLVWSCPGQCWLLMWTIHLLNWYYNSVQKSSILPICQSYSSIYFPLLQTPF